MLLRRGGLNYLYTPAPGLGPHSLTRVRPLPGPLPSTPESTGKADFPHDLQEGALQRRASHIATRGRRSLAGELQKVGTSLSHAVEVD